jgi:hypothetical protein
MGCTLVKYLDFRMEVELFIHLSFAFAIGLDLSASIGLIKLL